ncbi:hypothetical protein Taro_010828 [Colocasia esculenta]|uniref:ARM repeat superfamily protein n=1 Tax=Colocasia esculenta TaxID=4460 RepID=A0A843U4H5_COLES|nr:hypothetical protein [Colocasia esculenta]
MPSISFSKVQVVTPFPSSPIPLLLAISGAPETMSGCHCSLSPAKDQIQMQQRRSRLALFCALLRELFFSPSPAKVGSGVRNLSYTTLKPAQKEEPKLEESGEEAEAVTEGGEKNVEDMVEERGGTGDVTATALQRSVKQLHFGGWEEKAAAAAEVKRIAQKDGGARRTLAALGVIPSLVSMLDSDDGRRRRLAVQALVELANGSFTNKALMAEAGVLKRLPRLIMDTRDPSRRKECLECLVLLLSVSSLAKTQFPVAAGDVLPPLIEILDSGSAVDDLKLTCLGTLYNLSTKLGNARAIVSGGAVGALVRLSREKEASELALATLGNLVVTAVGKMAMEEDEMVPGTLFETMAWEDKPRSQELAVYVLMVLAQRSTMQRRKVAESGLVPLLLEVALLGTPVARKRALQTLQWFKMDTQTSMAGRLAPQAKTSDLSVDDKVVDQSESKEYRKDIKKMVKLSLRKNMEYITRRATVLEDVSSI